MAFRKAIVLLLSGVLLGGAVFAQQSAPAVPSSASAATPPDSTTLVVLHREPPVYPPDAPRDLPQAQVTVRLFINEAGEVINAEIVSGEAVFHAAALAAARQWKFQPFIKGGKAVPVVTSTVMEFTRETPGPVFARPEVLKSRTPEYPSKVTDGRSAHVTVGITIDETGKVTSAEAVSGDAAFHESALKAAHRWAFKPYQKDGKPVTVRSTITFDFGVSWVAPGFQREAAGARVVLKGPEALRRIKDHPEPYFDHVQPGKVTFLLLVGADGKLQQVETVSSSGSVAEAALEAVRKWVFVPCIVDGKPVPVQLQVVLEFNAEGAALPLR